MRKEKACILEREYSGDTPPPYLSLLIVVTVHT